MIVEFIYSDALKPCGAARRRCFHSSGKSILENMHQGECVILGKEPRNLWCRAKTQQKPPENKNAVTAEADSRRQATESATGKRKLEFVYFGTAKMFLIMTDGSGNVHIWLLFCWA
jgi:hypothetical protein